MSFTEFRVTLLITIKQKHNFGQFIYFTEPLFSHVHNGNNVHSIGLG